MIENDTKQKRKRGRPRKGSDATETMGWKCPDCGKVLAPHVNECTHKNVQSKFTDTIYSRNF